METFKTIDDLITKLEEFKESFVDLAVGDFAGEVFPECLMKFFGGDGPALKVEEFACLNILAKHFVGIAHADGCESSHTVLALEVDDYATQIEKQVFYYLILFHISL